MSSVVIVLIVAQLVVRGWLVATGGFYWDDLIFIGRASTHPILSWEYLGHSHDGHFMPLTFLVAGVSTLIAPLNWIIPAATLIVAQAIASIAVWRMIRVIAPAARGGAIAAFAFYLFTPMTVPAFAWWAAGLNSLPLQAAMAWIVAEAVRAVRGDVAPQAMRGVVIRSTIVFLVSLGFFEKSLFILPVAFVAAALVVRRTRSAETQEPTPSRDPAPTDADSGSRSHATDLGPIGIAFVRVRALWASLGAVFVVWLVIFFAVSDATAGEHSIGQTARLVWRSVTNAILPSFVGGPWEWERWVPSPPMGFAPLWMIVSGLLVVVGAIWWAVTRRQGAIAIVLFTVAYAVLAQVPAMWNRSSANTALELAQTMRYLPDTAVVITLAWALVLAAPPIRRSAEATATRRHAQDPAGQVAPVAVGAALVGALVVGSAMISLASFSSSWRDDPTGDYLANAQRSLAQNREHPMFDQALPLEVLLPVAYPDNQISHTFGRITDRSPFASTTDTLNVLDSAGNLVPGTVTQRRTIEAGRGSCRRPEVDERKRLPLDGPLIQWRWSVALSYCANRDGIVELALDGGPAVRVPVRSGLHVVYAQLDGAGSRITATPVTPGLALHTGEGRVGEVVEARLAG
ncbi:hypothetical protein GS4_14_00460 [Gordonia soli NBRC 108243]|uniref:Glycosyltransferase RgtA/B/C/D-like domain-containing protein n=1 Tax=Gordonia soli NBRC 108243 TaxID=1223545 RepID=M0QIT8_9ACTN|nr:hypothetical protein GS4_14_00460 [Gordonia soli NBRC 108243]